MVIRPLNSINAISIIEEIRTDGHSPLKVIGNNRLIYVVKNSRGQIREREIINEFIANYLLQLWKLPTANCSLVNVPPELIKGQGFSNSHKTHYYDNLCFGSEWIENATDLSNFLISNRNGTYNKLINPLDFLRITLFDEWVENDDRKPTNYNLVLLPDSKKYKIIPIDHAFIFSTMNYEYLKPELYSPRGNDHLLVSDLGTLIKRLHPIDKELIYREKEYFYLCIELCQKHVDDIFQIITTHFNVDQNKINHVKTFLFNMDRNEKVFKEHIYRLTHGA
jgi:hypothetical protein